MQNEPMVALFLALGIILFASRVAGSLARRFHQPRVLGELIVGVILGPTLLNLLHASALGLEQPHLEETIHELAELGVMLLMFNIGLEVHLEDLAKVGRGASFAGVIGALLPTVLTIPVVMIFGYRWQAALFAGVTFAATSVSISAQVLFELNVLKTKEGNALLATALIDDVIAILLVSLAVAVTGSQGVEIGDLVTIVLRMALYLVVAFSSAWYLLPHLMHWIQARPLIAQSYGIASVALMLALLYGWSAEAIGGMAAITGAFIAGVGLSRVQQPTKYQISTAVNNLTYAFLVPIFFVGVGLQINLGTFALSSIPFAAVLLIIAVGSKVLGCQWGARLGGLTPKESFRLGVCMISRGEVGLIIASLGVASGAFKADDPLFVTLFLVILLTTILTPPLVRRVFSENSAVLAKGA